MKVLLGCLTFLTFFWIAKELYLKNVEIEWKDVKRLRKGPFQKSQSKWGEEKETNTECHVVGGV